MQQFSLFLLKVAAVVAACLMLDGEAAELEAIASIGTRKRRRRGGASSKSGDLPAAPLLESGEIHELPVPVDGHESGEIHELAQIAAIGDATTPVLNKHHSREWALYMTERRASVRRQKEVDIEKARTHAEQQKLQRACVAFPGIQQIVSVDMGKATSTETAKYAESLSMRPVQRDEELRRAQSRAASLVASTACSLMREHTNDIVYGTGDKAGRTAMLTWVSHETKQRTRFRFKTEFANMQCPSM